MDHLAEGRKAIEAIAPDFVRLVRASAHVGPAIGHWGTGEVACHVSHVIRYDGDSLAGRALPESELRPSAVSVLTDAELEADPERDLSVLADRIEGQLAEFLALSAAPPADEATWLGGIKLPASAVVCHLLEELLVHGFDLAHATKQEWTIAPAHASLAIAGAAMEILNAAGPTAFVDPEKARGFRARIAGRLRGHDRFTLVFDDGLRVEPGISPPIDVHLSADPASMLLILLGRVSPWKSLLKGKVVAWGRVWLMPRMLRVMSPP